MEKRTKHFFTPHDTTVTVTNIKDSANENIQRMLEIRKTLRIHIIKVVNFRFIVVQLVQKINKTGKLDMVDLECTNVFIDLLFLYVLVKK